jgi:hypothetical protein
MEVATLLVGLLMIYFVPFTFLVAPIAVTLWFMSVRFSLLKVCISIDTNVVLCFRLNKI